VSTEVATSWTPDPFATQFERRGDGALILRPERELPPFPQRVADSLEHWARVAPARVLVARRGLDGAWRSVTYEQMLGRIQRLAAGLLIRNLSAERPYRDPLG
jgi:feruloyl-CoA synthase